MIYGFSGFKRMVQVLVINKQIMEMKDVKNEQIMNKAKKKTIRKKEQTVKNCSSRIICCVSHHFD